MIGLIDVDSKIPNLALMKISTYYKSLGEKVEFVQQGHEYEQVFASCVFTRNYEKCIDLVKIYGDKINIGGTGWDTRKCLTKEIEECAPDYNLYTIEDIASRMKGIGTKEHKIRKAAELVNAGMGFTSRGCIRKCSFCFVPLKEGSFRQDTSIKDIINPKSNIIILHDNNLTADPYVIDKLREIEERRLILDINQGIDIRLITDDIAYALSKVRHLRSVHFAWDLINSEKQILAGVNILKKYVKPYKCMCFMLVGYNTSFEEDYYRFKKLIDINIDPFIMVYNQMPNVQLHHFARWVNSRIYKSCSFDDYVPWKNAKAKGFEQLNALYKIC